MCPSTPWRSFCDLVATGRHQNQSEVLREDRAGFAEFDTGRFIELEDDAIEEMIGISGARSSAAT